MKFLKADGEQYVFHLGRREKGLLLDLLKMYPLTPIDHHRVSGSSDPSWAEANQKLLEEALMEHRNESKRALETMLNEPNRFQDTPSGFKLALSVPQIDWLLQVINDVRVGCWLNLGSPDEKRGKQMRLNEQNARSLWTMELCGHFEYALLSALNLE